MAWLTTLLIALQVLAALTIIVLVLLQHGKGADMGAAFGSGASGSLFGATGSANFLSRATAIASLVFFVATLGLAYSATSMRTEKAQGGVMGPAPVQQSAPKSDSPTGVPSVPGDIPAKSGATPQQPAKPIDVPK